MSVFDPPLPATPDPETLPAPLGLDGLAAQATAYLRATRAGSTQAAYQKDWQDFAAWCAAAGLPSLPAEPQTIGLYLTSLADRLAVATLGRRLAAIATAHRQAGHRLDTAHPAIHDLLRGVRRSRGTAQRRVEPATTRVVQAMVRACEDSLLGARDRALLLLGYAAALRRSEIVALDLADLQIVAEGLRVTLRRSKTDQEAAGETIGVVRTGSATCPVAAVQAWLTAAGITEGRLFRRVNRHGRVGVGLTDQSVALIIKRRVAQVGFDAALYSGHSLRAGLITTAAANGVEERIVARTSRHRSLVVLRSYMRDGELFVGNASGRVGL